jgi:transcription initiation factor TFIIIB Brf1 subunit/transcription initiation factor TFIIB
MLTSSSVETDSTVDLAMCPHENIITDRGVELCSDCGQEICRPIRHDKEWRYYGSSDTKSSGDPSRVQMRRCDEKNIFRDVENMGFNEKVVATANKLYVEATNGTITRGNIRKSIVFACIFHSFKICNTPQSHEKLIHIFGLTRKAGLNGLKYVSMHAPKDSLIHTVHITAAHLIRDIMCKFSALPSHVEEVIFIYETVKNRDVRLHRARPQSTACGIIYFWICATNRKITLAEFASTVSLSELTIVKISKIVSSIAKSIATRTF